MSEVSFTDVCTFKRVRKAQRGTAEIAPVVQVVFARHREWGELSDNQRQEQRI